MSNGDINVSVLKKYFEEVGFPVKELTIHENLCRIEYHYPDENRAVAMRMAFAKNGADTCTYYKYQPMNDNMGQLLSREKAELPFETQGDLRAFFNAVMDDYQGFSQHLGSTSPMRGQPGTPLNSSGNSDSSFRPDRANRRVLGSW